MAKFLRTDYMRYSKLGKNRKKLQKWRKPKGRHNKMREHRFGYPRMPTIGHKNDKTERGKIGGLVPIRVENMKELSKATKKNIIILARVGAKKKMEIMKKANEMGIPIQNVGGKK